MNETTRWTACHVRWADHGRRLALVCDVIPAVAAAHGVTWSFADFPDDLEVILTGRSTADEIAACHSLGAGPEPARTLDADLYMDGWIPDAFVRVQARCTTRAVQLLAAGPDALDDGTVALEMAAIHAALSGSAAEASLRWQAHWLAGPPADASPAPLIAMEEVPLPPVADAADCQELAGRGPTAQTSLVARLAHTQAIRLWGPGRGLAAEEEAALLLALAAGLDHP